MSGTVRLSAIAEMVYVEVSQGLRVLRGSPQQIENARESNHQRTQRANSTAVRYAAAAREALLVWQKTQVPPVTFQAITEKSFNPDDVSSPLYVRLQEKPLVIVRFAVLPSSATTHSAAAAVEKALASIDLPQ